MRCSCGEENSASTNKCPRCGKLLLLGVDPAWLLLDAAAAVALVAALGLVFLLDRWSNAGANGGDQGQVEVVQRQGVTTTTTVAKPLRLAVTPPEFDDVGSLLRTLGAGYRFTEIALEDLLDAEKLRAFDVVFVTCGRMPEAWLGEFRPAGKRGGNGGSQPRPEIVRRLRDSLRDYVGRGGTLYVSDWHLDVIDIAFEEFIDQRAKRIKGAVQIVKAEVVEARLARCLGAAVELRFDRRAWRTATFAGPDVVVYLRGRFRTVSGEEVSEPLLVQFPLKNGNVIFTAFHNEAQNSQTELDLLRFLVFTTVTAQVDSSVKQTLVRGGFSPAERNLLSASNRDQSVTQTYNCRGARSLQFVLGFEERGAELRLMVTAPDGGYTEKTGTSTFTIDVPRAADGQWKYTVTPLKVPYQNFPFTLTVGEKQ